MSSPLDTPARNAARGLERTKKEVLKDDPYAEVRMLVCRTFDKERPARDEASLAEWRDRRFDWEAINKRFGRETPEASTIRAWVNKRGRPGNRCWADMEDRRGQGPRRRRVTGKRLAIGVWHAVSHWTARRHPTVSKLWKDVEADTKAYNTGKPLIMHNGERRWATPSKDEQFEPVDREFFRQLVKRLESRNSYRCRYNAQAAQQRWEGGGSAPEPVRFLEIVQQDETEAPNFFFIDTMNRVPLGAATWVIAVCIYTHCVLAWDLSFDAPSKVSWMRNVLNASRMKPLPKEWADRFPALATIGGRMSSIMYDNPSHLIGHAVEDAHGDLVQDVIFAGEGQPTHKALVERTHETLRTLFAAELPGAKMQIALAREYNMDVSKETLLTLSEGRLAMARAVCKYHTTALKGLDMRTPLDVWVEQWNLWGPQHAKDQEQFARAIGDVTLDRALDNGGVVNEHLEYSDRRLTPLLMEAYAAHSHRRRNCKKPTFDAKVKPYPTDMSKVSVLDPVSGKYRKLPAKKKRYAKGLTLAMHKLVLRYRGAQSLMADPQGEERLLELRRMAETELRTISKKMEAAEQRARASINEQPVLRDIMGGDIHLVQVAPSTTGMEVRHDHAIGRIDAMEKPPRAKRGSERNDSHAQMNGSEANAVTLSIPAEFHEPGPGAGRLQSREASHLNAGAGDPATERNAPVVDAGAGGSTQEAASTGFGLGDVAGAPTPVGRRGDDDDDDIVGTFEDY